MEPFHVGARILSVFKKAHAPFKSFQQVRQLIVVATNIGWRTSHWPMLSFSHYHEFLVIFGVVVRNYILLSRFSGRNFLQPNQNFPVLHLCTKPKTIWANISFAEEDEYVAFFYKKSNASTTAGQNDPRSLFPKKSDLPALPCGHFIVGILYFFCVFSIWLPFIHTHVCALCFYFDALNSSFLSVFLFK